MRNARGQGLAIACFCSTLAYSGASLAAPFSDETYAELGLTVVYRAPGVVYSVDLASLELSSRGVKLWMQADFKQAQPTYGHDSPHKQHLSQADVDCLNKRYRFSRVRFYDEQGGLQKSLDTATDWSAPREGSVGAKLLEEVCLSYMPTLEQQYLAERPSAPVAELPRLASQP